MATWVTILKAKFWKATNLMPKCLMFEHGLTINPRGKVRPCCVYDNSKLDWNIMEEDKWRPHFRQKSKEMASGNWIPECEECRLEEKEIGKSLRIQSLERYENKTNITGIGYWDLKISNTCNLWCRMCSGGDSSTWVQQIKQNPSDKWSEHLLGHDEYRNTWHDTFLPTVKEKIIHADTVKFTGGEPMLVKHVKEVIQHLIDTEFSYQIELMLTTNGTVPFTGWWQDIISKFKFVNITLSIDGIEDRFEYQRANASWEQVSSNAIYLNNLRKKFKNLFVSINYTNTAINAACKKETEAWADKNDIFFNKGGVEVLHPQYMSYRSLPNHLRKRFGVTGHYDFDPKMLETLKKQMSIQDKIQE